MIARLQGLFALGFLVFNFSNVAFAATPVQVQLSKYEAALCGEGLTDIRVAHNIWAAKTTSIRDLEKIYANDPKEIEAIHLLLQRSAEAEGIVTPLAIKSYFESKAIGISRGTPSEFMASLNQGLAPNLGAVNSRALEIFQSGLVENKELALEKAIDEMLPVRDLDLNATSSEMKEFESALKSRIVGQNKGVQSLVSVMEVYVSGLKPPGRPVGNLLYLGPTGSGKTRLVEALAEVLFDDPKAFLKIDGGEFQNDHDIAKLIGAPPGYLGHSSTPSMITQEKLDRWRGTSDKPSILLVDELDKTSYAFRQIFLGVLDKGTLTLGDNSVVDLTNTIIIMTGNTGAEDMSNSPRPKIGFAYGEQVRTVEDIKKANDKNEAEVTYAAGQFLAPEFINRVDEIVVFDPLEREQLEQVLDIELLRLQKLIVDTTREKFIIKTTLAFRNKVLADGFNISYGARHLKRAITKDLTFKLSKLIASGQIESGDIVEADYDPVSEQYRFRRIGTSILAFGASN